ncbi:GNAT family N-acetyltransferase [Actinomadura nitritigenes]|uniref:GNAT family N-acetyltransferase n=1 Tax=Actinomadura nitritigenes TaxID=134602 RepID=A0ABS3RHE5_9ACTN|nr:GNAT family N-acetyltransferase [Actinomadura nitritigenes]MBO2445043.1 GNAT family N-acetyltransferase [Actinomadura nitritigenes]
MATVRLLEIGDWALYRSVRLASLAESPAAFWSSLAREEAFAPSVWQDRLAARNTFLAETADGPAGLAAVVPDEGAAAELVGMWVAPSARGRGIGDLLVRAALEWTADRGFAELRLWVFEGNRHAERLYARHGFARTGRAERGRPGKDEMQFEMARTVTAR